MKVRYLLRALLICLCVTALALAGCSSGADGNEPETGEAGRAYTIYTIDLASGVMGSYTYHTETEDAEALVTELLGQLEAAPEDPGEAPALSENTTGIPDAQLRNRTLFLDIPEAYTHLDYSRQTVVRAALVETLTQADEVDYVFMTVEGVPLTYSDGSNIGFMQASDFISEVTRRDEVSTHTVKLYFADPTQTYLVPVDMEVSFASHTSVETAVVRALVEGPGEGAEVSATLPSSVRVINVQTHAGTCYVNLGSEFMDEALDMSALLPVYSIVDSLTALEGVENVQLMVEGSSMVIFRNTVSLDHAFAEDLSYTEPGWDSSDQ